MITCSKCREHIVEDTKYTNWLTLFNFIVFLESEKYIELETHNKMIDCLMTLKDFAYDYDEKKSLFKDNPNPKCCDNNETCIKCDSEGNLKKRRIKMTKFRKIPVVIDATQWFKNGDHPEDDCFRPFEDTGDIPTEPREGKVVRYFRHPNISGDQLCSKCKNKMHDHGWIDTLEDGHNVCPGDWIITGIKGEFYPCKPDIFEKTYEEVKEVEMNG